MRGARGRLAVLFGMVGRSLALHRVSTVVTIASTALASGLVMATFSLAAQSEEAFGGGDLGFDAVLGARGSEVQLVLNAVFHLETSSGNLPWGMYQRMRADSRVEVAVPCAVGDNYRGFRMVGTTDAMFSELEYRRGRKLTVAPGGRPFAADRREAVIGAAVAERAGLVVGSEIHAHHGLEFNEEHAHDEEFVVVGILEPTDAAVDRVVFIPIEGMLRMSGHVLRGAGEEYEARPGQEIPERHREVSSVLMKLSGHQAGFQLSQEINREGREATLAWPLGRVMGELFDKLGFVNRILELVAYLVMVVAAAGILASIYNTMSERRREIAVLRALGARRRTVSALVLLEAGAIASLGVLVGFVVLAGIQLAVGGLIQERTGVVLGLSAAYHPALWMAPVAMVLLGLAAGIVPAASAYATDVADQLAD